VGPRRQRHNGEGKRGSSRAGPVAWFGPRRGTTRAREQRATVKRWAAGPKARRNEIFFFFFLFKYYKAFLNNFESKFKFESNHSLQKFKCNSMSAPTCFYPYI
jgi:hypothetical protein